MYILLAISVLVNMAFFVLFMYKLLHQPRLFGTVVMFDDKNLYLELSDDEALKEMYKEKYAVFSVKHSKPQK